MAEDSTAELAAVAAELYALDLAAFTAERNARAKAAKAGKTEGAAELARQIAALPKPSTAAWLVNQLGHHHAAELDQLLAVGAALREAQANIDPDELKALGTQRRQVISALGRQARALARTLGRPVGDGIVGEVEATLHAAMVDETAAGAVRSGRLVVALSPAGFGSVDLAGALALPQAPLPAETARRPKGDDLQHRRALREAQAVAAQAKAAAREAAAALKSATRAAEAATTERDRRAAAVRTLEADLDRARTALLDAEDAAHRTSTDRDAAQTDSDRAAEAAEAAAEALAALGT